MEADTFFTSLRQRRRAVQFALRLTEGTSLAPAAPEQLLLSRFAAGELTIAQLETELQQLPESSKPAASPAG